MMCIDMWCPICAPTFIQDFLCMFLCATTGFPTVEWFLLESLVLSCSQGTCQLTQDCRNRAPY